MERKIFTITSVSGGHVKVFTLSPDDSANIAFEPGQFAMIHKLENGEFTNLSRPYSIASAPSQPFLRFAIRMAGGEFTSYLDTLKAGDKVGVNGPLGHFTYRSEDKAVFIAAGTGAAPIIGMLEHIALTRKQGDFLFLYSAKDRVSLVCDDPLHSFSAVNLSIKVVRTLTKEQPENWAEELGRMDENMLRKYVHDRADRIFFICGPAQFASGIRQHLLSFGVPAERIRFEGWG